MILFVLLALAAPKKAAEDPLDLAGTLVREGAWDRAAALLVTVDPAARGIDPVRYWSLRGLVALHDKDGAAAVDAFTRALALATEGRELLELHLARASLLAGAPGAALAALDRAGEVGAAQPGSWLLRAECQERLGDADAALAALEAGATRFPARTELARQQVFLLVRLGLFREARTRGEALLARAEAGREDALAIAEALRRSGEHGQALTLLQAALLQGEDRELLLQAARVSLDDGQPRGAARHLERAAALDPALALQAAEAWRRAGDLDEALRCNAEVADPAAKARQRLGLLLEAEAFDQAVALEDRVRRLGLDADDDIAYGLAYAWFRLGEPARAEGWLLGIRSPEAFARATELRQAMAACDPTWGCG